jgi:linoleate 10R-lipoxygenase
VTINETSSYVDLAPLYGNNEETLNMIRVRDGRGLLLPDTFTEERLLLLPHACCALLVLFNRNHNVRALYSDSFPKLLILHVKYIASKLLEINERNTWRDPDEIPLDDLQRELKFADQDEEIFQTARLINCSWFASIVLSDYISSILGLVRQGSTWILDPFEVCDSLGLIHSTIANI